MNILMEIINSTNTKDYAKNVNKGTLKLETLLIIEKILELQNSYYEEYNILNKQLSLGKEMFFFYQFALKYNEKLIRKLEKIKRNLVYIGYKNEFINKGNKSNYNKFLEIHKKENEMLKLLIPEKPAKKTLLIEIFTKTVINKYKFYCHKLTNVENKIVENLKKRFSNNKQRNSNNKCSYSNSSSKRCSKQKMNIKKLTNNENKLNNSLILQNKKKHIFIF